MRLAPQADELTLVPNWAAVQEVCRPVPSLANFLQLKLVSLPRCRSHGALQLRDLGTSGSMTSLARRSLLICSTANAYRERQRPAGAALISSKPRRS